LSIAASVISFFANPARCFAIGVFFQVSYQTVSFIVLPDIINEYLVQGFLFYLIALQLMILPLLYFVPAHLKHSNRTEKTSKETPVSRADCYKVLAAMGLFFICQTGVFSFVDLIGNANGLDDKNVGFALSISTFIGLFGAVIAVILADRYGRFKPILFAGISQLIVLSLFDFTTGLVAYTTMLALFQLCWNLSLGYQFDTLVIVDKSHRFASVVPAAQAAGIALGPILAGNALEIGGSPAIYLVSGIALLLFLVLILPRTKVALPTLAENTNVADKEVTANKTTSLQIIEE
jgi:predicted MFS family arabinose efflux permease